MPIMKNISERKFVIAGKELDKGQEGEFAQSVIDRHVADYAGELVQVDSRKEEVTISVKVDTKDVTEKAEDLKNDPELTDEKVQEFSDSIKVEAVEGDSKDEVSLKVTADAPQEPKKRGPKPKNK